jgi:hypothetical protein
MEVMTPEQRFERIERVLGYFVREGRRWRVRSREQDEKINMLIHTQMETSEQISRVSEQINRLADETVANHAIHNKEMADLRKSQELTDKALHAFIDSLRKGQKEDSSA